MVSGFWLKSGFQVFVLLGLAQGLGLRVLGLGVGLKFGFKVVQVESFTCIVWCQRAQLQHQVFVI